MYGRLLLLNTDLDKVKFLDIFKELEKVLNKCDGFVSVTYFGDEIVGEYGAFTLWASEENAKTIRSTVFRTLKEILPALEGGLWFPMFEVFEVADDRVNTSKINGWN